MYARSVDVYDAIYEAKKDYAGESKRIVEMVRRVVPDARTLLDVACGTGLHLQHLRECFEVEGLDVAEGFVEITRRRNPGVAVHVGDMRTFELPRRFDVVTCLFSAIGYVTSLQELHDTLKRFAAHVRTGGMVLVEAWFTPETWRPGGLHTNHVERDGLVVTRMCISGVRGRVAVMDMHHLVGRLTGIESFVERHEMFLFTHDEYVGAFEGAGLAVQHDLQGDRGIYWGVKR